MRKVFTLPIILILLFSACTKQEDITKLDEFSNYKGGSMDGDLDARIAKLLDQHSGGIGRSFFVLPESDDFANIPQDPKNPLTIEKVELGRLLFHDPGMAVNPKFNNFQQTYSCATCHHFQAGFQSGRPQGISEGGEGFGRAGEGRKPDEFCPEDSLDIQPIRTPTILNSAYQEVMLWNGQFGATGPNIGTEALWAPGTPLENNFLGFQGVETQSIAGIGVHRLGLPLDLVFDTEYVEMFDAAFPDVPKEERYSKINAALAIAAFERTVLANQSPFQKYLKGNLRALTESQKKGTILYFGKANCVACHTGPALNSMDFYAYGMADLQGNGTYGPEPDENTKKGRGGFTGVEEDYCKFKVPQLYSLRNARFLGHGSSFRSVEELIRYKNNGKKENTYVPDSHLAAEFVPLNLSEIEIKQLTAFIEFGLSDAELGRYEPASVPSGLCIPNNDEASRLDLGCILP